LQRADSLVDFIAALNRARHDNPALHGDDGLRFVPVDNDQLIAYTKTSADGSNVVLCVVNLDTQHTQSGWVELDLPALGLEPQQAYQMHDLISDEHFMWNGPRNFVILDPQRSPSHVMRLRTQRHRENDFDYFA
jgi:starch synthase (maltosyl-transferring)